MKKMLMVFVGLVTVFSATIYFTSITKAENLTCSLPTVLWLGEGKNTYTLPVGYDGFLFKQTYPFTITKVSGPSITTTNRNDRVWATSSFTETLITLYNDEVDLGILTSGDKLDLVIIDDDNHTDQRFTDIKNIDGEIYQSFNNGMVSYITFLVPNTDHYILDSQDSIGFIKKCITKPTDLPTQPEPSIKRLLLPLVSK